MNELEKVYCELFRGHLKARKRKRHTRDEHQYELRLFENLMNTAEALVTHRYHPSRGIAFVIRRPVVREIFAAPYRDRVVHHYIFEKVSSYWERQFIYDSYSCRKGKGTLKGIRRMELFMRKASHNFQKKVYILKYDLSGYFMSLPQRLLYKKALQGLRQQYQGNYGREFKRLKFLWHQVIFDNPTDGVQVRGSTKDWRRLPARKSLFKQPEGFGVVIGNLTSQLLSNIFLNDFDHYMKEWLHYRYYGRYVDDFYVLVEASQYQIALRQELLMRQFLTRHKLRLNLNKTYRQDIRHGTHFLGVVIYPHRTVAGRRLKQNFTTAVMRSINKPVTFKAGSMISYVGFLIHHNCFSLTMALWRKTMICQVNSS